MARVKRAYRSPVRQAQARRTRERIARTALRFFARRGFLNVTIAEIARAAGVSTPTVYATFGSKAGILLFLEETLGGRARPQEMVQRVNAVEEPREQLRLVLAFYRDLYGGVRDLMRIVRGATEHPEVAPLWDKVYARRRTLWRWLVPQWARRGALRVPAQEAQDVLFTLVSSEVYWLLVVESGWAAQRFEGWLGDTLEALLFKPRHPRAQRGSATRVAARAPGAPRRRPPRAAAR